MSAGLLRALDCCLLLVDLQRRLVPAIAGGDRVVAGCAWLLDLARACEVPVLVSEHCARSLGPTVDPIAGLASEEMFVQKTHFSCAAEPAVVERVAALGRGQIVVAGMEAHVCVLQSSLGFAAAGYQPFVVADASGSRDPAAAELGFERMRAAGVPVVNREMVFFEWLERAGDDRFRALQRRFLRTGDSAQVVATAREGG